MQIMQLSVGDFGYVGKRGPDEVRDAGGFACVGQVFALLDFVGQGGFFPVVCYAKDGGGVGYGG